MSTSSSRRVTESCRCGSATGGRARRRSRARRCNLPQGRRERLRQRGPHAHVAVLHDHDPFQLRERSELRRLHEDGLDVEEGILDRHDDPNNLKYLAFAGISKDGGSTFINKSIATVQSDPTNNNFNNGFINDYTKNTWIKNSLYASWDEQFYPDGMRSWMVKLDAKPDGGISIDPRFFAEFGDLRSHQVRLEGGDASSDSYCYS